MLFRLSTVTSLMLFITLTDSFAMQNAESVSLTNKDKKSSVSLFAGREQLQSDSLFKQYFLSDDHSDDTAQSYHLIENLDFSADFFHSHSKIKNGYLRAIVPLWVDKKKCNTLFLAPGISYYQQRLTYNTGIGFRRLNDSKSFLWGFNTFYDYDSKGNNRQLSEGIELNWPYIGIYGNMYLGLNGWHTRNKSHKRQEKPASGHDLKLRVTMPFYPQLSVSMHYFSWKGQKINLYKEGVYRNSPNGINYSVAYQPVPLLGFSVNHSVLRQKSHKTNTTFVINVTYNFSRSMAEQILFSLKPAKATLSQQLFRPVEREYGIVLNTREKKPEVFLPPLIRAIGGQATILAADATTDTGTVSGYQWSAPSLPLQQADNDSLVVVAPQYIPGNSNSYPITLTVIYNDGQTVSKQTVLTVHPAPAGYRPVTYGNNPISGGFSQSAGAFGVQPLPSGIPGAPPPPPGAPPPPPPLPSIQAPPPSLGFKVRTGMRKNSVQHRVTSVDPFLDEMNQRLQQRQNKSKDDLMRQVEKFEKK